MRLVTVRFILVALVIPIILYILAGTLSYWQGWLYWTVLIVPMIVAVVYFLKTDPELLERRMKYKEKEKEQRTIVLLSNVAVIAGFLIIGYDLRLYGLNQISPYIVLAADAGVFFGYGFILWVFKENSYAARTIEVERNQKVISTGPYSIVRHPMYSGFLIMLLLTPIALGSLRAVPVFLLHIPILVWRIYGEEKMLLEELPGYYEYCINRPYRLLPFIW